MSIEVLAAAARPAQRWRNGGGITFEVARAAHPRRDSDFLWRVSIAEVTAPGPFSPFPGHERLIAVVNGDGMELHGIGSGPVALRPFTVVRFAGSAAVEGRLPHGAVRDFNVIYDAHSCRADLGFYDGPGEAPAGAAVIVIVNVGERACAWRSGRADGTLERFDAVKAAHAAEAVRWTAGSRVALVRIDELS